MDSKNPPEYTLELCADRSNVKEVVKGILHTIFFHRYFTPLEPQIHEVLSLTLPCVSDDDIATLIEQRTNTFIRQLDTAPSTPHHSPPYQPKTPSSSSGGGRGQLTVQFLEKKRRKGWFVAKADEETMWESWTLDVTLTSWRSEPEAERNRRQMERLLQSAATKIVRLVNQENGHIPPITTTEANPFPYQILVGPRSEGWSRGMGIF